MRRLAAKPGQGRCTAPRAVLPGLGGASGIKNPKEHGEPCGAVHQAVPRSTGATEAQALPGENRFPSGSPAVPRGAGDAACEEANGTETLLKT